MTQSESSPKSKPQRFLYVDGLRGFAAMAVVLYHFRENLESSVESWMPGALNWILLRGNLGVDIFFVLSGFVIAHSVRNGAFTWGFLGRFALRRSIRLDPPLWITIFLEIVLIHVGLALIPSLGTPLPSWQEVLSNLTYTQRFLGYSDVVPVFWSLTYEVQFYFILVFSCVVARKVIPTRYWTGAFGRRVWLALTLPFLYSLLIYLDVFPLPLRGLFIDRWFQFYLGVAAWAAFQGHIRRTHFGALVLVSTIFGGLLYPSGYRFFSTYCAVATALSLFLVGNAGAMGSVLSGPVFQFLGKISYSLYLIHLSIGWRFITLWKQLFGPELGVLSSLVALTGGVGLSVLASWLFYVILEAPSMKLARRVSLPKSQHPFGTPRQPVEPPEALDERPFRRAL